MRVRMNIRVSDWWVMKVYSGIKIEPIKLEKSNKWKMMSWWVDYDRDKLCWIHEYQE